MGDYTFYIRMTTDDVVEAINAFVSSKYPAYEIAPAQDWENPDNEGERHTIPVLLPVTPRVK